MGRVRRCLELRRPACKRAYGVSPTGEQMCAWSFAPARTPERQYFDIDRSWRGVRVGARLTVRNRVRIQTPFRRPRRARAVRRYGLAIGKSIRIQTPFRRPRGARDGRRDGLAVRKLEFEFNSIPTSAWDIRDGTSIECAWAPRRRALGRRVHWDATCTGTPRALGRRVHWDAACTGTPRALGRRRLRRARYSPRDHQKKPAPRSSARIRAGKDPTLEGLPKLGLTLGIGPHSVAETWSRPSNV